jgi:hypothetical protein
LVVLGSIAMTWNYFNITLNVLMLPAAAVAMKALSGQEDAGNFLVVSPSLLIQT